MQGSKRLAAVGAVFALGVLGATGTAAATTAPSGAAHGTTTTAPAVIRVTPAVIQNGDLPKGWQVKRVPIAQFEQANTVRPAIGSQGCSGQWGVQIFNANTGYCIAYGDTGTASSLSIVASGIFADNNYGRVYVSYEEKVESFPLTQCEYLNFEDGSPYPAATVQKLTISGFTVGLTCTYVNEVSPTS